jgi:HAD superfamily hydrolase (TIGR01490 family)
MDRELDGAPRVGAFFDMDKTLIAENSGSLYLRHRYERGEIGAAAIARGLVAYLRYKVGLLDLRSFTQEISADFAGRDEAELLREAQHFVEARVVPALYPGALERVAWHAERGHLLAIVSGATRFVVEPLAQHLGIPSALYTRLEVERGVLTGRVIDPICFEEGKIFWIRRFVEERGVDLARSWFYTDSITDLPLLDLVGHPVAVNPDPILYRKACYRRWPVVLFDAP